MKKLSAPSFTFATKNYCLLTKPGIIFGNAVTTAGGFALASAGRIDFGLFFATLLGLSAIVASGCVFNNYLDREADGKMARTRNRPLVQGLISSGRALLFAVLLAVLGTFILAFFTNPLAVGIALFGLFVYVVLYTFSKYYTVHGTLIGSVAGAVPPVVGYTAVTPHLDAGAILFFTLIVLWQMPHFYAISIFRLKDYAAASLPLLPLKRGMLTTKIHMLLYILAFTGVSSLLTFYGYVGMGYLVVTALLGFSWLILCIQGFYSANEKLWARKMFLFSLLVIMGLCLTIPFTVTQAP